MVRRGKDNRWQRSGGLGWGRDLCVRAVIVGGMLVTTIGSPMIAYACSSTAQVCSSNYQINEAFFGTGGQLGVAGDGCSTSYCAKSAVGELGVGVTVGSSLYKAQAGFDTDRVPSLTFVVNTSSVTLTPSNIITPGTTAYGTATFSVKSYLASNYSVVTSGTAPNSGTHYLTVPNVPGSGALFSPDNTQEQFGINLVANSSCGGGMPASLGSNPVQVPSSAFSYGVAASNYNTPCSFTYNTTSPNNIIASSSSSSGETDYTISYILNITNVTPGGTYTMNQVLVATSTF